MAEDFDGANLCNSFESTCAYSWKHGQLADLFLWDTPIEPAPFLHCSWQCGGNAESLRCSFRRAREREEGSYRSVLYNARRLLDPVYFERHFGKQDLNDKHR